MTPTPPTTPAPPAPPTPFENLYHLRKVSDSNSKSCAFCYKLTTSVLITKDGKSDFFYTCDSHLKDPQFAIPLYDDEYKRIKQEKETLDKEIINLKQKWDEKNRYSWTKLLTRDTKNDDKNDDKNDEPKHHKNKLSNLTDKSKDFSTILNKPPRTYQLQKDIFKIRLDKKMKPKINYYSTSNVKDISTFPSVPSMKPN